MAQQSWIGLYTSIKGDLCCPQCKKAWYSCIYGNLYRAIFSCKDALLIEGICNKCGWQGKMVELEECALGAWHTVIEWWKKNCNENELVLMTTDNSVVKDVDQSLRKQMDNNLRSVFG
jgi:hypothetical protein